MPLLYEIFPVFLFFIAFKFYDIYVATVVGIVATSLQALTTRARTGQWDRKQIITLLVFVIFGGMTLYFHDPIFIKWKPTIIFWLFALILLGSQLFTQKPVIRRLMEGMLEDKATIPTQVWGRLNVLWAVFFIVMGAINLYIAYHYSNDVWVNFKFYGITSALFIISIMQAAYLSRYISSPDK